MYNEVIPGMYLCKMTDGVAYYLVYKRVYDAVNGEVVNGNQYFHKIEVTHLLSGNKYHFHLYKINLLNWEQLPLNYQQDACACNEDIRRKYYEVLYPAQNKRMSEHLKKALFTAIDKATGELKFFNIKKDVPTAIGPVYELQGASTSQATRDAVKAAVWRSTQKSHADDETDFERAFTPEVIGRMITPQDEDNEQNPMWYADKQDSNTQHTNNSSMNLGSIPGLNLNFGLLEKGRIAISINGDLAFKDKSGQYVTIEEEGTQKTRVEVGDLKFDIDFYKVPTQELELGDVILLDNELLVVNEKKNGDIQFINPLTGAKTTKLQRSNILGMYFYTKVISLFDMAGGGKGLGLSGLDPMTLMLLSQGGNGGTTNGLTAGNGGDLSQMLVLSQLTKGGSDLNPMMLMALSGSGSGLGGGNMMQTMLMMQALGGKGGGLFGKKKVAAKPVVTRSSTKKKAPAKKVARRVTAPAAKD